MPAKPVASRPAARDTQDAEEAPGISVREAISTSEHGAPAAGAAVSDIFSTDEIFSRVVATADDEFDRSSGLLFQSGLAAGLSMSMSFLAVASLAGALGADGGPGPITSLLYPLGFLFVALGRYQLFTENTLTPVTLVLTRMASIPRLLRIWGIVFSANVLGSVLAAFFLARTNIFSPEVHAAALDIAHHALDKAWTTQVSKGVVAGWLVAGMVWLNHAAHTSTARVLIIFFLMYVVAMADLAHCIVGSSEVLYLVFHGEATAVDFLWRFLVPVTLGNTIGGVLLVAFLNYSQTQERCLPDRDVLSWREWMTGR